MENVKVDVLIQGFPGRTNICGLSWSSMILVTTNEHNIMIDLGSYPSRRYLLEALQQRGMKPEDVDTVCFTHLHHDHVAGIDLFPHALFIYGRKEWEYANLTTENAVQQASLSLLHAYPRRLLEDGEVVFPGISAMLTPGHTPGGISYVLDVQGEKWVVAGDAVKNRGELMFSEFDMTSSAQESTQSICQIKKIADVIIPGHDCMLRVCKDGRIEPMRNNTVIMKFPRGVTVNGQNPLILEVD